MRATFLHPLLVAALALGAAVAPVRAYDLIGRAWPSGTINMSLQLDATKPATPALPLLDGQNSWNAVAAAALNDWNNAQLPSGKVLLRSQFTTTSSLSTSASLGDGVNNVFFTNTIYGDSFDSRTLAVTLSLRSGSNPIRPTENDVLVNTAWTWNSYRGSLQASKPDLRRVLLHEFGHVLGLDHPDQATPSQSVSAVMNSTVSNVETLQDDDKNGAFVLYGTTLVQPQITQQPSSLTVNVTDPATLAVSVSNLLTYPSDAFQNNGWWYAQPNSTTFEPLIVGRTPTLTYGMAQKLDAGRYYFQAGTPDGVVRSNTVTLTVNSVQTYATTQLINVATRGFGGSGANAMIVGFVVRGGGTKRVLLRAAGPALTNFGLAQSSVLPNPVLTVYPTAANRPSNDNWETQAVVSGVTAQDVANAFTSTGAFPFSSGSLDAAILSDFSAVEGQNNYSAIVSNATANITGTTLVEAYDAESPRNPNVRLVNLSTRGFVGTGGNILIAGFVIAGPGPRTFLIRAVGDSLQSAPFNLTGTLDDPYLKLYHTKTDGSQELVREQDDWDSPSTSQPALQAAFTKVGAFTMTDRQECAILVTLPPGQYSAQMSGLGDTTGIGLVEVYEVPE